MKFFTYFLHAPSADLIKIGQAHFVDGRIRTIQLMSPVPLNLVAVLPGDKFPEKALHRRFAHHRRHGEWFGSAAEIRSFAWRASVDNMLDEIDALLAQIPTEEERQELLSELRSMAAKHLQMEAA